ncbi:hypothetical protein Acsp04_62660 [Actinomadura sp. NBRC 104425]|nr:hypothetical protein Acsp04_62660 [Actinomadura sp. NBRC 104425]
MVAAGAGPVTECGPLTTVPAQQAAGSWCASDSEAARGQRAVQEAVDSGKKGHVPQCRPLLKDFTADPAVQVVIDDLRHDLRALHPARRAASRRPRPQERTCSNGSAAHIRRTSAGVSGEMDSSRSADPPLAGHTRYQKVPCLHP